MSDDITQLLVLRRRIAAMSQALAERELAGRVMRLEIEARLQTAGATKTDSEKKARADEQYLVHEKRSIEISYDRDVALAEAEALRLGVQLRIADLALGVE